MTIFVLTIGFDEKFATRFMLRNSIEKDDLMLIVAPHDWEQVDKAKVAIENVISLAGAWIKSENIKIYPVNLEGLEKRYTVMKKVREIASDLYNYSLKRDDKVFKACLSGGLRALILLMFMALGFVARKAEVEVSVEVDFENLAGRMEIPLSTMMTNISDKEGTALKTLSVHGPCRVEELASMLRTSKSTVYRILRRLLDKGLIERVEGGKYFLSERGKVFLEYYFFP